LGRDAGGSKDGMGSAGGRVVSWLRFTASSMSRLSFADLRKPPSDRGRHLTRRVPNIFAPSGPKSSSSAGVRSVPSTTEVFDMRSLLSFRLFILANLHESSNVSIRNFWQGPKKNPGTGNIHFRGLRSRAPNFMTGGANDPRSSDTRPLQEKKPHERKHRKRIPVSRSVAFKFANKGAIDSKRRPRRPERPFRRRVDR